MHVGEEEMGQSSWMCILANSADIFEQQNNASPGEISILSECRTATTGRPRRFSVKVSSRAMFPTTFALRCYEILYVFIL